MKLKRYSELLDNGKFENLTVVRAITVKMLFKELNLNAKQNGLVANEKKAGMNDIVTPEDRLMIIPYLKGGSKIDEKYTTLELIEDLRAELKSKSEILAQMFPERVNRYTDRYLSRFWRGNYQYIHRIKSKIENSNLIDYKPDFRFSDKVGNLKLLEEKLIEKLGAKALGCLDIIRLYKDQNSGVTTLQFIEMIEKELGRVSGDVEVTDIELSLMLGGYDTFVRNILDTINNRDSKRWYNPDYKFTKERIEYFKEFFKEILYYRAAKCLELIKKYEDMNPDLEYWHEKDYSIINPRYFKEIDTVEKSYWFGFLYADAHLNLNRPRIQFELAAKDKDRIEQFVRTIGLSMERIEEQKRFMVYRGKITQFETVRIRFSSEEMASDLDNNNFKRFKVGEIGLPPFVELKILEAKEVASSTGKNWRETDSGKIAIAFLLGFYDGDGTYMGGRQAKIYSSNKRLLDEIKFAFDVENRVNLQSEISQDFEEDISFEKRRGDKPIYYLTLGPELFDSMMNSYSSSMIRKRRQESKDSLN